MSTRRSDDDACVGAGASCVPTRDVATSGVESDEVEAGGGGTGEAGEGGEDEGDDDETGEVAFVGDGNAGNDESVPGPCAWWTTLGDAERVDSAAVLEVDAVPAECACVNGASHETGWRAATAAASGCGGA